MGLALPLGIARTAGAADRDVERGRSAASVGFWRRGRRRIFLLRGRIALRRRRVLLLRGVLLDRTLFAGDAVGTRTDVGAVVAAGRVELHRDLSAAAADVLHVVAAGLATVRIVARRPVVPAAARGAGTLFRTLAALATGLELLFAEVARTFVAAGAVRVPGVVLANPLLDAALATGRLLLRAGALALRSHRSVICRGAGERTCDNLTGFEDALAFLEVLTVHLEGRVKVGIADRSTEVARAHARSTVGVPELPVDDEGLEVVARWREHDAARAERATLKILQFVPVPVVDVRRLGIDARWVAELGTSAVLLVGLHERVRLARHPAFAVHAGGRIFWILAGGRDLAGSGRGTHGETQVAVLEIVLDLVRFGGRVGGDRFAEVLDRTVLHPPGQNLVVHEDRAGGVTDEVVHERGRVTVRFVVPHDHVLQVGAVRVEKPVLILAQGQAGVFEGRDELIEFGLRVVDERGVADDAVLWIILARVGIDDEVGRPHLREGSGIDRNAIDFDLDVHMFTRRVAGTATEAKWMETIHPLADADEDLVLAEMEDLADDAGRVPHDDVVARAATALGVAFAAVRTRVLDDARRDREDRVGPVVVGDVAIPALMAVVGTAGLILVEFAADVTDFRLLGVGVEERARTELTLLLPVLVERIGEGDVDRRRVCGLGDRRDDEDAADRNNCEQDETQIHDVLLVH